MENNSRSEHYIVKEAENIIDDYLSQRKLKERVQSTKFIKQYKKLKIISIIMFILNVITILLSIIKY